MLSCSGAVMQEIDIGSRYRWQRLPLQGDMVEMDAVKRGASLTMFMP